MFFQGRNAYISEDWLFLVSRYTELVFKSWRTLIGCWEVWKKAYLPSRRCEKVETFRNRTARAWGRQKWRRYSKFWRRFRFSLPSCHRRGRETSCFDVGKKTWVYMPWCYSVRISYNDVIFAVLKLVPSCCVRSLVIRLRQTGKYWREKFWTDLDVCFYGKGGTITRPGTLMSLFLKAVYL